MNIILLCSRSQHFLLLRRNVAQHKQPKTCFICICSEKKRTQKISPQNERLLLYSFEFSSVSAFLVLRLYFLCCYTNRLSLLNIFSNETDVFFVFVFKSRKIYKCICLLRKKDEFLLDQRLKKIFFVKNQVNKKSETEKN